MVKARYLWGGLTRRPTIAESTRRGTHRRKVEPATRYAVFVPDRDELGVYEAVCVWAWCITVSIVLLVFLLSVRTAIAGGRGLNGYGCAGEDEERG